MNIDEAKVERRARRKQEMKQILVDEKRMIQEEKGDFNVDALLDLIKASKRSDVSNEKIGAEFRELYKHF